MFELRFDPKTIEHLGVKMYATLPPALAELISNAYDADSGKVEIRFNENTQGPVSITIIDDGTGMSYEDVQSKFLVIGRNRRDDVGDKPSLKFGRLPTGKKGLGKLALFGLAKTIVVDTTKDGKRNRFILDWDALLNADGTYRPISEITNQDVDRKNGTEIKLSNLKRKSSFNIAGLADSLSRIFFVDDEFKIVLNNTFTGETAKVSNDRRVSQIDKQFEWSKSDISGLEDNEFMKDIEFSFITSMTPIPPSSGLRGITIFSRGKMVNQPEFFSNSTSSHFFQYLTGSINADFIDLLDEDVISTNRQSINWDNEKMSEFRFFLGDLISKVNSSWRIKRKRDKDEDFKVKTGIDKGVWFSRLPEDIKSSAEKIVTSLEDDDGVSSTYTPVIEALYKIIPEYPLLHWRHLHEKVRDRIKFFYESSQYGLAADQGAKILSELVREIVKEDVDGTRIANFFSDKNNPFIKVADLSTISGKNIQDGQGHLVRGIMTGFRNPMSHGPIDKIVPAEFSELDCLNVLSLISYLVTRMDGFSLESPKS